MTGIPLIGVLAVQGDVREHVVALRISGARTITVRRPEEVAQVDGLVIPGGESTTMDKLVRAFGLQGPLRERIAAGMPVYGSCAGMILLADRIADARPDQQTLGGLDITVRRNAFGRQVDSFEEDLHIRELGGEPVRPPRPPVLRRHRSAARRHGARGHHGPRRARPEGAFMSGHSKWATTKHKKAAIDAKRGKLFAKLIKNIEVAARTGGGDPAGNPTLYDAIQKAKKTSVPNSNIDNAVKRGSGATAGGANWETITYEGYAPGGVAVLIECLTDNRNRAAAEVRTALTRNGGQLADPGPVSYVFDRKGVVIVPKGDKTEDDILEIVLEAGADEVNDLGEAFEVISEASDFVAVRTALQEAGVDYDSAEASWVPNLQVPLDLDGAKKMIRVIEALEDSDDVQDVFANGDIPDDVLAQLDEE